ncbi:hypothetical protein PTKU46_85790 [Paraburkholderia terrae]
MKSRHHGAFTVSLNFDRLHVHCYIDRPCRNTVQHEQYSREEIVPHDAKSGEGNRECDYRENDHPSAS